MNFEQSKKFWLNGPSVNVYVRLFQQEQRRQEYAARLAELKEKAWPKSYLTPAPASL